MSVMIILDHKPKGFVLTIFFFKEHENMHMHMITGLLNVLKLSMNSCSFVSAMNSSFTHDKFLKKKPISPVRKGLRWKGGDS